MAAPNLHSRRRRSSSQPPRPPQKRALIIGIAYHQTLAALRNEWSPLYSPHRDAPAFRDLLIRRYDYQEHKITMMLDRGHLDEYTPTRDNILREMKNLVKDAQPGDQFVLFYTGHAGQIECRSLSEDDGLNEVILPVDHRGLDEKHLIEDNILREYLVEPLTRDCRLTAIFDACTSGTLMDLPHHKCHIIESRQGSYEADFVGKFADCKLAKRQDATNNDITSIRKVVIGRKPSGEMELNQMALQLDISPSRSSSPRRALKRLSSASRRSSGDAQPSRSILASLNDPSLPTVPDEELLGPQQEASNSPLGFGNDWLRCQSPPCALRECDGKHPRVESPTDEHKPDVWSISACQDGRMVHEADDGSHSFAQGLIRFLDHNPHPTFRELMDHLKHTRKKTYSLMGPWLESQLKGKNPVDKRKLRNIATFSMPILGSEKKKDIDTEPFTM
ncbi:hypothetical protein OBBRIDRAFT_885092 [Obba rivulosa]|uniref:Peptidase C14 caspase domain-containing protein n=1 Tax=Obba rivulosa TaxID=1052685 RepID=A0A8E2DQL0_9APHY|nr:hypothetical protein OBBRIDRAFT_885092 [Obba rivulosa]